MDRCDGVLVLNEHGDLYFSLHNFGVQIIPFKYIFILTIRGKTLPRDVNYDLENNNSRNVLSRCCS